MNDKSMRMGDTCLIQMTVTGIPSTGTEAGERMIDVTLIAMAISAIVLLATAVTVRRR